MTGSEDSAKKYALKLLSYRGRSEHELRERLKEKKFSEDKINETIEFLKHAGFLDDFALTENLIRQSFGNKLLGHEGTKQYLRKRGISKEVMDANLEYDEEREISNILKLMDKKFSPGEDHLDKAKARRAFSFLIRRGYSINTIKKAMRKLELDEEL